jgi:prepilin-type N-terminal cleavage/methylation domain-containing protein
MPGSRAGFTLIELMIVIAIIAIIALIAIPNLFSSRIVANETSAIGSLRSLASAQAEFQARHIVDQDNDGLGEYGFLQELTAAVVPRGFGGALDPPVLSQTLGNADAMGLITKSGYAFVLFLPGAGNAEINEPAAGAFPGSVAANANEQEIKYACYAVPAQIRSTGNRAFVVNQQASVFSTANLGAQNYDIANTVPLLANPNAAYEPGADNLSGKIAMGVGAAQDGGTWVPAS